MTYRGYTLHVTFAADGEIAFVTVSPGNQKIVGPKALAAAKRWVDEHPLAQNETVVEPPSDSPEQPNTVPLPDPQPQQRSGLRR